MPKYIVEIDSENPKIVEMLTNLFDNLKKHWSSSYDIDNVCIWQDGGSTFVSNADIIYEG